MASRPSTENIQNIGATLRELARILAKHDHPGQADVVWRLLQDLETSERALFELLLKSVDVWGGADAVWEVGDLGDDTQEFRYLIIKLVEKMDQCGLGMERSRFVASTFSEWNRIGL